MNADPELDATLGRQSGVALNHAGLHLDRASHRVDHAAKLDEAAVPGALDDAAVMRSDRRINQIAAQPPQPRQGTILVRCGEAGYSRRHRRPGSQQFSGSRSWRALTRHAE
jgi:hypothetical protein